MRIHAVVAEAPRLRGLAVLVRAQPSALAVTPGTDLAARPAWPIPAVAVEARQRRAQVVPRTERISAQVVTRVTH